MDGNDAGRRGWGWLIWLAFFSVFDAVATDIGIRMELIREANPFAKALYDTNPALFYSYKIVLPALLLLLLPTMNGRKTLRLAVAVTTVIYGAVAFYHAVWIVYAVLSRIAG